MTKKRQHPTEKQIRYALDLGINVPESVSREEGGLLICEQVDRSAAVHVDDCGQSLRRDLHPAAGVRKAIEQLLGLWQGVLAPGPLSEQHILLLDAWLHDYENETAQWPASAIAQRVRSVLASRVLTEQESTDLRETLESLIGDAAANRDGGGLATVLPVDLLVDMQFTGRLFCLTGTFLYGPRQRCEAAIIARGGLIALHVGSKLDYLVIGQLAGKDWKHSMYGTKIESAIRLKREGAPICVVSEETWTSFLLQPPESTLLPTSGGWLESLPTADDVVVGPESHPTDAVLPEWALISAALGAIGLIWLGWLLAKLL